MLPLVTSLPPTLVRRAPDGRAVGEQYAAQCLASWRAAGFMPVSVNAPGELNEGAVSARGALASSVTRDARHVAGRPLVFLHDLVQAALRIDATHVAIANADVLLDPGFDVHATVRALPRGVALLAKRIDVVAPDLRVGTPYEPGYDFFAMPRDDLARLPDVGLVFGLPWWDHFLPTWLRVCGVQLVAAREPFVFHLRHEDRWPQDVWSHVGWAYTHGLLRRLRRERRSLQASVARGFERGLRRALRGGVTDPAFRLRDVLARLLPSRAPMHRHWALVRAAAMTTRFIDAGTSVHDYPPRRGR